MGTNELLPYDKEDEITIWKMFERTPQSAEEDVETIKNWIKTQPHIPEILRKVLFLIVNFMFICMF